MIDISVSSLVKILRAWQKTILDGLSFTVNTAVSASAFSATTAAARPRSSVSSSVRSAMTRGEVSIAPSKRLGLISQIPVYPGGWTVEQVLRDAHQIHAVAARMNELEAQMEHDQSGRLLEAV